MSKIFVSLFAFVFLMTTIVSHAQTSRKELEKKKDKVEKEISSLQKELDKTQKNKNATLQQVNALKKKISERQQQINGYSAEINSLDKGITQTKQQITTKRTRLEDLQSRYASMVLYNYRHRNAYDRIMFVLSAHSFNEAFQRLRYMRRYSEFRKNQSVEIRSLIVELTGKQNDLVENKNKTLRQLQQEEAQKQKLAKEKKEQDKLVKNMSAKEKKLKTDLANKKKEQDKLNKKIEDAIRREIAAASKAAGGTSASKTGSTKSSSSALTLTPEARELSNSFATNQGKFPWPVEKGNISESFGVHAHPQLENVTTKNNGVDIKTSKGAAVRSVFKGKVVSIVTNPLYHKGVIIRHGEYFTVYTNLESVNVKAGDEVTTKQSLGTVYTDSETGLSTVHFEVWKGTVIMNPENWLARK